MNRSLKTLIAITFAYLTFFGAVLFSVTSNAALHDVGTFVPAACGEAIQAENQPVVLSVCMGDGTFKNAAGQIGDSKFTVPEFQAVAVTL